VSAQTGKGTYLQARKSLQAVGFHHDKLAQHLTEVKIGHRRFITSKERLVSQESIELLEKDR
jgi:hypothetical protein